MAKSIFIVTRLERSEITRKVKYDIIAQNKKEAVKKLEKMDYLYREADDELEENHWKPLKILDVIY
ncbi:hypothetical protein KGQ27_00980 [Patescibacteria group bacterium]|nr:hypothetical protein [Patescibacteria group bacterium]MDE1946581.1 hypothetical protein [Patescibacteria group bacterium]MDE2010858.1 hypothetical protein [Patescibacteria group bacterium]MDE2233208.1 hypothetical protein [Patescibacteria group bacterium]